MTVTASHVITKQGMILIFCFERFAVQKFIDNDIEFADNFSIGKFTIIFFKFRRIFKPIFHSAKVFFASCHEANGILCPFFISSCMTSASFIACNVSSLQVSKRTSNGNPPACMDFRRKTLIAVVKLRPRALYKDSLCFFISESIFILKVDVIDIDITSPVLVYIVTIRLSRGNCKGLSLQGRAYA